MMPLRIFTSARVWTLLMNSTLKFFMALEMKFIILYINSTLLFTLVGPYHKSFWNQYMPLLYFSLHFGFFMDELFYKYLVIFFSSPPAPSVFILPGIVSGIQVSNKFLLSAITIFYIIGKHVYSEWWWFLFLGGGLPSRSGYFIHSGLLVSC